MQKVYEFNKVRNKFSLDMIQEVMMLQEEVAEFYEATTLAERIDAIIDVRYVYEGTEMKYSAEGVPMDEDLAKWIGQFHRISTTIIAEELGDNSQYMQKIMERAYTIVCDANAMKTTELDENGKVIKGNIPNATEQIANMLAEVIG